MRIPTIHGYIDRRILINFVANPDDLPSLALFLFRALALPVLTLVYYSYLFNGQTK